MHRDWTEINVFAKLSLLACLIISSIDRSAAMGQNQFTFMLPAGATECFFQPTLKNWSIEVEYQVLAGAGLDVGFTLISPSGHRLTSDFRKSEGIHMVEPTDEGDYRLCFDNSFSKLSEKMVFFEVIVNDRVGNDGLGRGEDWADAVAPESLVDYKLEDIRESMDSLYRHLERSRQVQTTLRAFETRDRYLLENNLWRVSFWSCLNLLVMLTVAVTQIYTLRRLFEDKRAVTT
ncbi:transmembrane emp24 domain-containing protein 1-like [Lampris incognitus]|uniref:transmembrane emp24 domain-containing protein 1-like n=1 Tax=Lampris incognitus TaxID=2546036 RepID=UPI0024B587EC|nr:transmembrane emp24 domain-containing protein 1-like [Lampris incognitus]